MGRVCMVPDLVAELVMGRVCYGPSLSWAEFVMGRDVPESSQSFIIQLIKRSTFDDAITLNPNKHNRSC